MALKKQVDNHKFNSIVILLANRLVYLASLSEFYLKIIKMIKKNNIINIKKKYEYNSKEIFKALRKIKKQHKKFSKNYG
jgi:hypothetical protein